MRKFCLTLSLLLGMFLPCQAAPESILADYGIRRWRGEDGLGEDIVNSVDQSSDGYIWCATQNQVFRFDGQRFVKLGREGLPEGDLGWRGITTDRGGILWAFGERGLFKFDGRTWSPLLPATGPNHAIIQNIEEDPKGVMWAASDQGLYRFDRFRPTLFPCGEEGTRLPVFQLDVAPGGQMFVVAGPSRQQARLFRFENGRFRPEPLPAEYSGEEVSDVHAGSSGTLWVTTSRHLLSKTGTEWKAIPNPEGQPDWAGIRTMAERQDGELWVGAVRGLFRWNGKTWSELTTRDGFFPFAVRAVKEDREGGLWVAGTGGLMRLSPKALHVFTSGLGYDKEPCISLLLSGTEWWLGVAGVKPLTGTPGNLRPAPIPGYPEFTTASALLKTRDGSLWIGTHSRNLWRSKNGKTELIQARRNSEIPLSSITALLENRTGKIWVGTLGGLATVSKEGLAPFEVANAIPRDPVNALCEDADGTVWVGYQTQGLLKIARDGSTAWFRKGEGLPDNSVRTLYRDKSGVLWIGTTGGLVRWAKNRQSVFTTAQGLVDDAIRQIIEDDHGYLWLGTRFGLMRINAADFIDVEGGAKATLGVRTFGWKDGMKSEECTGAPPVKTPDGKLWFPTMDGLVMADSGNLPKTIETPRVYIEEVQVNREPLWLATPLGKAPGKLRPETLVFPSGARGVEFHFSSPDYFAPERVRFKYRIEGLDSDWSAPTPERSAWYPAIPPGSYHFRVQSCSRDGIWSAEDGSIGFSVPPLFWQAVWFKAAAGALALSAIVLAAAGRERKKTRRKMRQLEHEQTLERERTRIARDIHDEVGAGLTEMALLSELAQADLKGPGQGYLDDIFRTAQELTRSLDEIVWSINPANDTLEKLISYLVEFSRDFLGTASLPCRLEVPTLLPPITVASTLRHQICLAVKETLNNIVKHAGASEVRMEIQWEKGTLHLLIKDNGCGFEPGTISDPAATRDGLKNLRARMREIGGTCDQQSTPGQGTRTLLSVEIPTDSESQEQG